MGYLFDGPNKIINLTTGTIQVSVRDLWSRWVDWFLTDDNSKYQPAFKYTGGDDIDIISGTKIPIYSFLTNNWKIKPQESNHTLSINDGILLVDGGGDPFINTNGTYSIRINYSQPVQAIGFNTGNNTVSNQNPWLEKIEGNYTAQEIMKLLVSVSVGKTNIIDNLDGTATIIFKGLDGITNRITTEVIGSERTNITLNL